MESSLESSFFRVVMAMHLSLQEELFFSVANCTVKLVVEGKRRGQGVLDCTLIRNSLRKRL